MALTDKFRAFVAVYMFFIKDEKILLLRRFNTGFMDGMYSVVAGHLDGNETVVTAAIRETREEAGVKVKPENVKVIHVMHRMSKQGANIKETREYVDFFVEIKDWEGDIKNMEPEKCDDLSWFDLDKLPENIIPYVKMAIENYKNKVLYSEDGWE